MIRFPDTPEQFAQYKVNCQFGITEAVLPAIVGGISDLVGGLGGAIGGGLGDLLGGTAAAAGTGAAGLGALGTGAADLVGPTVAGTIADTLGGGAFDALSGSALAGTGADMLGAAGAYLAAPAAAGTGLGVADLLGTGAAASGADAAASTAASTGLASGVGSIPSATAPMDAFLNATPAAGASAAATPAISTLSSTPGTPATGATPSVFDTGTTPVPGLANTGTGYVPAGAGTGATGVSAPASVATVPDPTSAVTGGAQGAAGVGTPAAAPTSSISQLLSKLSPSNLASDAISSLAKNPLGIALGAGGLGYNILEGQKQTANEQALSADAATATANSNQMVASGEALQQYLTSGTLPPQYMQQVDQAIQSAKTAAISNAAAQGLPTDPTKNTALAATLAGIDNQRAGMISQVASQLFSSGSSLVSAGQSAAGLSGQLYQALVSNDTTQAGNIGKAIASLAAALNGKSQANIGGTNITLSAA